MRRSLLSVDIFMHKITFSVFSSPLPAGATALALPLAVCSVRVASALFPCIFAYLSQSLD